jgi:hypothetical protein
MNRIVRTNTVAWAEHRRSILRLSWPLSNQLAIVVKIHANVSSLGQRRPVCISELRGAQHFLALPALELSVFSGGSKKPRYAFRTARFPPHHARLPSACRIRSEYAYSARQARQDQFRWRLRLRAADSSNPAGAPIVQSCLCLSATSRHEGVGSTSQTRSPPAFRVCVAPERAPCPGFRRAASRAGLATANQAFTRPRLCISRAGGSPPTARAHTRSAAGQHAG